MTTTTTKPTHKDILLIEDEGEMCLLLNLILNGDDRRVAHVKTLAEAVSFLQKKKPSLILMDNRLPDGFGFDFIGYLKANYPSIKIIMISGVDRACGDFALEAGADAFLPKPFTKSNLIRSVNSLLN